MKKAVTILLASAVLLTGCGAEENKTSSNNGKKLRLLEILAAMTIRNSSLKVLKLKERNSDLK